MDWIGIVLAIAGLVLGVGSPIASMLYVQRRLIELTAEGNWMLRKDHDEQMKFQADGHARELADRDRQIGTLTTVTGEQRATIDTQAGTVRDQALALVQSTDSARVIEPILTQALAGLVKHPLVGDNGREEAARP